MTADVGGVRVVVNADDFGVCHAINEGIVKAFREGIVTQTSIMAPTPWFTEAAALARQHKIPVVLHSTFTAEWDNIRWRPLTKGATLAREDGTCWASVEDAMAHITPGEADAELEAQYQAIVREGLSPVAVDFHMGPVSESAMRAVAGRHGIEVAYDSTAMLSGRAQRDQVSWLISWLDDLQPGLHRLICHPGVDAPELAAITSRNDGLTGWARDYRVWDLAALCDPRVREAITARGIRLVNSGQRG
jgi:hypothetical protein